MSKLTSKERNKLKSSTFGLPGQRKYPMPDKEHAIKAKGRATQMEREGKLSESSEEKIEAKANKMLDKEKSKVKTIKSKVDNLKTKVEKNNPLLDNERLKKKPLKKEIAPKAKK